MDTETLSYGSGRNWLRSLMQMLAGAIVLLAIIQFVLLVLLAVGHRSTDASKPKPDPDQLLKRHLSYVNTGNRAVLWHHERQWLSMVIDWDADSGGSHCGSKLDPLVYYYHYCRDRARYPILTDRQCWRHIIRDGDDNQTAPFEWEFRSFFTAILNGSVGLAQLMSRQLDTAANYSRRIGADCEHPAVFERNFDPERASARTVIELYEFYCYRSVRYPNVFSRNSGKLFIPGYYQQLIDTGRLHQNEQWMKQWMAMFIDWYQRSQQLQQRHRHELQQAWKFAAKMNLSCHIQLLN